MLRHGPSLAALLALALLAGCMGASPEPEPACLRDGSCPQAWTSAGGAVRYAAPLDEATARAALEAMGFDGNATDGPWPYPTLGYIRNDTGGAFRDVARFTQDERWTGEWNGSQMVFDRSHYTLYVGFTRDRADLGPRDWARSHAAMEEKARAMLPRFEAIVAEFEARTGWTRADETPFQVFGSGYDPDRSTGAKDGVFDIPYGDGA